MVGKDESSLEFWAKKTLKISFWNHIHGQVCDSYDIYYLDIKNRAELTHCPAPINQ